MGIPDITEKQLLMYNEVFCSVVNYILPEHVPRFDPSRFIEAPTEYVEAVESGKSEQRMRDVFKLYRGEDEGSGGVRISCFIGVENQTSHSKNMLIRAMDYDIKQYKKQAKYLKGKMLPVLTIVLYFGYTQPWSSPLTLSELLELPKEFEGVFNDYKLNLIDVSRLTASEKERLGGDLRVISDVLESVRERRFEEWVKSSGHVVVEHGEEVFRLLSYVTKNALFEETMERYHFKENVDMCEYLEQYNAQKVREGIAIGMEKGMEKGMEIGREHERAVLAKKMLLESLPIEVISKITGFSVNEIERMASSVGRA